MQVQERLLTTHFFFDFSWIQWNDFLALEEKSGHVQDPFQLQCFRPFPGRQVPATFAEALIQSRQCKLRRISRYDSEFPRTLETFGIGTPVIYTLGETKIPNPLSLISVVGTRTATVIGERCAYQFSQYFVEQGLGIVSGLARGIDGRAHQAALDAEGMTIAVLGSSIENIYPKEHEALAHQICSEGGLVLSEFPPGTDTQQYFFPRRNEMIAALSSGILVVEAPPKSGAQITAKFGLANGIPVVVPPRDFNTSIGLGALGLIQIGAWPIASPAEALESFAREYPGGLQPLDRAEWRGQPKVPRQKYFTLAAFCQNYSYELAEGIARLEKLLKSGALEQVGPDQYQESRFTHRAK